MSSTMAAPWRYSLCARVVMPRRPRANILDAKEVKTVLDEAFVEAMEKDGLKENHKFTDVKLALGLIACAMAALAHFYPRKFPANMPALIIGCSMSVTLPPTQATTIILVVFFCACLLLK